jgi:succinate-semialdehyde dehydrogenase/glutarate-semialdehyde dehydrogenase
MAVDVSAGTVPAGPVLPAGRVRLLLRNAVVAPGAETFEVRSPYDDRLVAELPAANEDAVESAVAIARRAQRRWAEIAPRERARVLLRFHDLVLDRQAEGLDLAQLETGKARFDAFEELADLALTARHYARVGPRRLAPKRRTGVFLPLTGVRELRRPKGVVGVISPWNYPLTLAVGDALPALLAGNAVVVKPDHRTTLTALWCVELLRDAGIPDGVLSVVPGTGPEVGPHLIDRVDYVMFTGSTQVGREVARRCGERLIGASLELGGKNPMIVRADADLARAAAVARRACFANAGQLCISIERIYVPGAIADDFLAQFVPEVRRLRLRAGVGWGGDVGSLISQRQLETVSRHVDDAVAKGAEVLVGGRPRPDVGPYFFEPTVLQGVTEDMAVCRAETFGPVVSVYRVRDDEEALQRANDSAYGLNASVLTRDTRAGRALAARLTAGTVNVNEGYAAAWGSTAAPMGGMRDSGLGRRHGAEGLLKYTESQTVAVQRLIGIGPQLGRTDEQWARLLTGAVRAMKALGVR